ncbi:MAG: hypothetical protein H8E76_00690 [Helicobacteraceae bacterium]|nr:hypothetical protein [Candidatus Sulfurimonas ponti]
MHNERMSIMGLFGAPVWLSSAVLFRLSIVDAIIASVITFIIFSYIESSIWISRQFESIGIDVVVFDKVEDFSLLFAIAMSVSVLLASLILLGHKEEV